MPKGSRVHKAYIAIKRSGMSAGSAARIAQKKTGQALATGRKPKHKSKSRRRVY